MSVQSDRLRQVAVRWYMRLRDAEPDSPLRGLFEAWVLSDPAHAAAYKLVEETMEDFSTIERVSKLSEALAENNAEAKSHRKTRLVKAGSTLVAILFCAGLSLLGYLQYSVWQSSPVMQDLQTTHIAQISKHTLEDGTVITANANSTLEITYYRNQRRVDLKQGEASFEVAKDTSRPFVVNTETTRITVLGTKFAVNKLSNRVRISVDHGRVQVENQDNRNANPLILEAGQVAEVVSNHMPQRVNRIAADGFSFTEGMINFDHADMLEVAETLSRYRQPKVIVQPNVGKMPHVSALFKVEDTNLFIQSLPQNVKVDVQETATRTMITPR